MVLTEGARHHQADHLKDISITNVDKLAIFLIILYWLVYENVLFFYASEIGGIILLAITFAIKFIIPFCLLLYSGISSATINDRNVKYYLLFFVAFLSWLHISTALNGNIIEWLKLVPRFAFFVAIFTLFYNKKHLFSVFAKFMVYNTIYTLLQYILIYMTAAYVITIETPYGRMTDISGLYANVASMMYFPSIPFPIIRLTGYWSEPSIAAANCFVALYLALYLHALGHGLKWRILSYFCLVAGLLTFSNAGYLAMGISMLAGVLLTKTKVSPSNIGHKILYFLIAAILISIVVFGRDYVKDNYIDNDILRAIVGLRDLNDQAGDGGRFELIAKTNTYLSTNVIGIGLGNFNSTNDTMQSASAIIMWLLIGGYVAVILLLGREFTVALVFGRVVKSNNSHLYLVQALVALMTQQLAYGSWMNPNYFILVAAVLAINAGLKLENRK